MALVSASGPPNTWAKSCMKAWSGIRMPTSCEARRKGIIKRLKGVGNGPGLDPSESQWQESGDTRENLTHRSERIQVLVELL